MSKHTRWVAMVVVASMHGIGAAVAQDIFHAGGDEIPAVAEARRLREAGREVEAVATLLQVPEALNSAAALARANPRLHLATLTNLPAIPSVRLRLLEGELRDALGETNAAVAAWRAAAQLLGGSTNEPAYYTEPPPVKPGETDWRGLSFGRPIRPFEFGTGGADDNWLVRRFLAAGADADADRELARVWVLHQKQAHPREGPEVRWQPRTDGTTGPPLLTTNRARFHPAGFTPIGLQFALDYARRRVDAGAVAEGLDILQEPVRAMHLDYPPGEFSRVEPLVPGLEERQQRSFRMAPFGYSSRPKMTQRQYLDALVERFEAAGRLAELTSVLERDIAMGTNRLRRVLAHVQRERGRPGQALDLELDYLAHAKFNALTLAVRRGEVLALGGRRMEALAEFEAALKLPQMPFFREAEPAGDWQGQARAYANPHPFDAVGPLRWNVGSAGSRSLSFGESEWWQWQALHDELRVQLVRLHNALGQLPAAQAHARDRLVQQFAHADRGDVYDPGRARLDQVVKIFRDSGAEAELFTWLREQLMTVKNPWVHAQVAVLLSDGEALVKALAAATKNNLPLGWTERLRKENPALWAQWQAHLSQLAKAGPSPAASGQNQSGANPRQILEALFAAGKLDTAEAIPWLQAWLDQTPTKSYELHRFWPTSFWDLERLPIRSPLAAALRLAHLYERTGNWAALQKLGLSMARRESAFREFESNIYSQHSESGLLEHANAVFGIVISAARGRDELAALAAALKDSPWTGAQAQVARRLAGQWGAPPTTEPPVPWANLPPGLELYASADTVSAFTHNERHLFVGHPWGFTAHDLQGKPLVRVALGAGPSRMIATGHDLWVTTHTPLPGNRRMDGPTLRVDTRTWQVQTVPWPLEKLSWDGRHVWFGGADLRRYDPVSGEVRLYPEVADGKARRRVHQMLHDGRALWVMNNAGDRNTLWRYEAETWREFPIPSRYAEIIAVGQQELWLITEVGRPGSAQRRPVHLDRRTGVVTLVELETPQEIRGPSLVGWVGDGPRFRTVDHDVFAVDRTRMKLVRLPATDLPISPAKPVATRHPDFLAGQIIDLDLLATSGGVFLSSPVPTALALPDGEWLRAKGPGEDFASSFAVGERFNSRTNLPPPEPLGGLYLERAGQPRHRLPSGGDPLPATAVWDVVADPAAVGRGWLCTDRGLAWLEGGRVTRQAGWDAGLVDRPMVAGAVAGGRLWFASQWDHLGGGLYAFDPTTLVFRAWHQQTGLLTDKLAGVEPDGDGLKVVPGVEFGRFSSRGDYSYRKFPPLRLDFATQEFTASGPAQEVPRAVIDRESWPDRRPPVRAWLGGWQTTRRELGGRTWLCGPHGLIVFSGAELPLPNFPPLPVTAAAPASP